MPPRTSKIPVVDRAGMFFQISFAVRRKTVFVKDIEAMPRRIDMQLCEAGVEGPGRPAAVFACGIMEVPCV